ncbi:MAG: trypsin-like peptidase domain-containing protein [Planctomycetota bacterium]
MPRVSLIAACFLLGAVSGYAWRARGGTGANPPSFRDVVARSKDAVVGVRCVLRAGAPAASREGTGFLFHDGGLVLTNAHLVEERMLVLVEVPHHGRFVARVVSEDAVTDLAVLRLDEPPPDPLPTLAFGDSDGVREGDWVLTVGHPLSLRHTVTAGLVSHLGRHFPVGGGGISAAYLQFSAAVNPGSSGGPVLDAEGRVVGITTSKWVGGEGLAFAVPSKLVQWVLGRMEAHAGEVPRGYLGVSLAPGRAVAGAGAQVTSVEPDGPGWRAGLRAGDVVVRFAGEPVTGAEELYEKITQALPTTSVDVEVRSRTNPEGRRLVAVLGRASLRTPATPVEAPRPDTTGGPL